MANIFPGDMLWRNFGVTRYGRVVFYDYDEIEYLTDVTFRRIPRAAEPRGRACDEPWYRVARHDVFPEEFAAVPPRRPETERALPPPSRRSARAGLLAGCQRRIEAGEIVDFFPYPESLRFSRPI